MYTSSSLSGHSLYFRKNNYFHMLSSYRSQGERVQGKSCSLLMLWGAGPEGATGKQPASQPADGGRHNGPTWHRGKLLHNPSPHSGLGWVTALCIWIKLFMKISPQWVKKSVQVWRTNNSCIANLQARRKTMCLAVLFPWEKYFFRLLFQGIHRKSWS